MVLADQIKRRRKHVVFYPDLSVTAQIEAAEETLAAARKKYRASENSTAVKKAVKAVTDLKASAAATVLEVELEALSRKQWAEIQENHPARDGKPTDKAFQIGWDSFVAEAWPLCVAGVRYRDSGEAVDVEPGEWAGVIEAISDSTYQAWGMALLELNRGPANPF